MENSSKISCKQVTRALWFQLRSGSDIMIPRFTPRDWWECDLWRLTKAGFVDEYEIKTSVGDYRADFAKDQHVMAKHNPSGSYEFLVRTESRERKHDLLAAKHERCPNRFWFVMPATVAERVEIPNYAGLMTMIGSNGYVHILKPAPWLHRKKFAVDHADIMRTFMWRFWNLETAA